MCLFLSYMFFYTSYYLFTPNLFCNPCEGNYVINYPAIRGPKLQNFVIVSLIQLVCRIINFGWFDDDRFRETIKEATDFLGHVSMSCMLYMLR
jgi:hypothetical protein